MVLKKRAGSNANAVGASAREQWQEGYKKSEEEIEALLSVFLQYLRDREALENVKKDPEAFHDILTKAQNKKYIHYTRLAAVMGLSDASTVSRWFKEPGSKSRKTPDPYRRVYALRALARIVRRDIERIEAGLPRIGGLSLSEHKDLEVEVVADTVDA